jgi:hypothetical protein
MHAVLPFFRLLVVAYENELWAQQLDVMPGHAVLQFTAALGVFPDAISSGERYAGVAHEGVVHAKRTT